MEATIQTNVNHIFSAVNDKWIIILDVKTNTDDSWLPSDILHKAYKSKPISICIEAFPFFKQLLHFKI